ncbi:MAG: right-handed parallel beta-helix repeat-containing protein [Gammaproteobacteria bacterium]|nr:right-handed parallel beta-helix repeat-containing protein [Gammaproteobacteria bacterium]
MDGPAQIGGLEISGDYLSIQHLTIDRNKEKRDAIRIRNARHISLQHLTVRNGAADGVDIQDSQDIWIQNLLIHHFLAGSFEQQKDAHGIAASNTQRLTIANTEIHQTSGDSFQADPARAPDAMSNDIVIKDSYFWTGPLAEDFNAGWRATAHLPVSQRQYPGENAIDTKVVKNNWENTTRMRLTIDGLRAHGWKADAYITNKAVFNLKEKIDIRLNNIEVYDCEMAFRLRGNRGNAQVSINNAKIYQCGAGIRAEDGLQGLVVKNSVFGVGLKKALISVGTTTRQAQPSWTFQNNVFHGAVPKVLRGNNNRSFKSDSL